MWEGREPSSSPVKVVRPQSGSKNFIPELSRSGYEDSFRGVLEVLTAPLVLKIVQDKELNTKTDMEGLVSSSVKQKSTPVNLSGGSSGTSSGVPEDPSVYTKTDGGQDSATTKFVDDANVVRRDELMISHIPRAFQNLNDTQTVEQSIRSFLSRPIILAQGTFSTTDTYSFLNSYVMPYAAFSSSEGAMWTNKLSGFFGFSFDMRFRIVVNGNKFQQGRYCVGWVPLGAPEYVDSVKHALINNMYSATLVQRTTIPHVEIDLNTETSAELLVPYASNKPFITLTSMLQATFQLGYINVYPYSPLVSPAGSTVSTYTLYVSLENVQLFGAAVPQSGHRKMEIAQKDAGPISGVARSFAKGFKEFRNIPLLSTYAQGAEWISDRIANVASIFGFSKPTAGDNSSKLQFVNNPNHSTVDGDSDSRSLGFVVKPSTVILPGMAGTEYDEMDFSYVGRKYAYFMQQTWATTDVVGQLAAIDVTPSKSITAGGAVHFTPVAFVASFFNVWRGSLRFRLKFVKTIFHSGRLAISFGPIDSTPTALHSEFLNRQIVDIRDVNELEFIVPYINPSPWIPVTARTGIFYIEVIDPLVAPSTVSSSINILVEIAAGDDFEVGVPGLVNHQPTIITPQSGHGTKMEFTIGDSEVAMDNIAATAVCMGEKITSFRPLLRRFTALLPNSRAPTATARINGMQIAISVDGLPLLPSSGDFIQADFLTCIASCYTFWSGGVRIRDVITPNNATTASAANNSTLVVSLGNLNATTATTMIQSYTGPTGSLGGNANSVLQQLDKNNSITVEVPQYTMNASRLVNQMLFNYATTNKYYVYYGTRLNVNIGLPYGMGTGGTTNAYDVHNIFRAMADDGNLSLFIAVPPMVATVELAYNLA